MHVADAPLQQLEERLLGPVQVLDHDDRRPLGGELLEERDPRLVQTLARCERMQVALPTSRPKARPRISREPRRCWTVSGESPSRIPSCSLSTSASGQ